MTQDIRNAIDLHLRQGQYPKAKTLADYLVSKGIATSPQEAFDHMKEYQEKGMLKGNPELVELLKTKKTKPENLVEKVASKGTFGDDKVASKGKQIPMVFDNRPFAIIPGVPKATKPTAKTITERDQSVTEAIRKHPPGDSLSQVLPNNRDKKKIDIQGIMDFLLDGGALAIALVVDIVMNVVGWGIIAYDAWTRIAFIASAFVVVLFALRAWLKGGWYGKALWLSFALIASFLDISVALASSHQQSLVSVYDASKDEVLIALKTKEKNDADYLQSLRALQLEKGTGYKSQVDLAVAQANASGIAVSSYHPTNSVSERGEISSAGIFTAIPDAMSSGVPARLIALVFFSLFFLSLQLVIISSATNSVNKLQLRKQDSVE